jgi:pyruvate formate lyase activating enzyme
VAESHPVAAAALEAKSPYELRVNLGKNVPESDVRAALATGDMGFLHSFTTGSAVDGPGIRVVAWRRAACGGASTATTPTPGR